MARCHIPPQDQLWLELDRPTNPMTITSVLWTATPVDPAAVRAVVVERLLDRYPVFRRRVVTWAGQPWWEDDPGFDVDRHVVAGRLAGGAGLHDLAAPADAAVRAGRRGPRAHGAHPGLLRADDHLRHLPGHRVAPAPVGRWVSDTLAAKTAGVLTNVPGPRSRMALAGSPVEGMVAWAPCGARQALTVCVVSYAGAVTFGFGTDRAVIGDPERLVAALEAELGRTTASI